jgi:hypothetical protein
VTRTLLAKELRALRPYWLLSLVLVLLSVLDLVLASSGPRSLATNFGGLTGSTFNFVFALVALALGTGLSVKERDEGTLAFLDALPVTRTRVFLVKVLAAMAVLTAFPAFQFGWVLLEHWLGRGSLDWPFHWNIVAGALLMQVQLMATFLAVGCLLGFARSLTWMLVGVLAIGVQRLTHSVPRFAAIDPFKLVESGVEGVHWRYDVEAIATQAAIASVCLLGSWWRFTIAGRGRTLVVNPRPVVGAIVALLTISALGGAFFYWAQDFRGGRDDEPDLESLPSSAPATTTTRHYEFSYPSIESKPVLELADRADDVFVQVGALLGVDGGAPILVDLSGSLRNTAGTAFRDRIRMVADVEAVATLAHESAHVIARRVVGEEGLARWQEARVLDEGLASWVEGHFLTHQPMEQVVLAALLDRHELELGQIIDFDVFSRSADDELKYVIGRGLIGAMEKRYGPESIHRLVAAFGDETLPPKLAGAALWQATFQLAGMDLGLVADDFFSGVEQTLDAKRPTVQALPRPEARLVTKDGWFGVQVHVPVDGIELVVRFRPAPDSSVDQYDQVRVENDGVAWREAERIQRQRVCFQAGLRLAPRATLFEPWTCLPLSAVAPWDPDALDEDDDVGAAGDAGAESAPLDGGASSSP